MSGITNWRRRAHIRSMSDSRLDRPFWPFTPSPLGLRNRDNLGVGVTHSVDIEAKEAGDTGAVLDGTKKAVGATIIFHSSSENTNDNAPMQLGSNPASDDHNMQRPPVDGSPQPHTPTSRKIIQDPYAMLEEEERAERMGGAQVPPASPSATANASVSAWSRMHDHGYADFQGFILAPINEREPDENMLIALPPPPRYKKNATPAKVQPTKRRPRLRQASSLPNSPMLQESSDHPQAAAGEDKNQGPSDQHVINDAPKIAGDSISRNENGTVSDGQRAEAGEGLTDGIELRLDENRSLGPGVAGGLDWPLAWQWSPIGSFSIEAGGYEAEMGQVDSGPDSSSSRTEQEMPSSTPGQAPPTSLAATLTLPSDSTPPRRTDTDTAPAIDDQAEEDKIADGGDREKRKKNCGGSSMLKDGQREWQRRPLLSHGTQGSISSVGSSIMTDDGPASTTEGEPRISISSTLYQASSNDHSHSHSLYHTPMPQMIMSDRASFMDLHSPTTMHHEFDFAQASPEPEPVSPISFAESPLHFGFPRPPKPPLPTTPKPNFHRQPSPMPDTQTTERKKKKSIEQDKPLPPTTNFLDIDERAELVRKSRKLARVFGETPGADAFAQDAWRPTGKPLHLGASSSSRRHSMPLSPDNVSFLSIVSPTFDTPAVKKGKKSTKDKDRSSSKDGAAKKALPSPTSFIDLSDEENAPASTATKPHLLTNLRGLPPFASAPTSPLSPRPTVTSFTGNSLRPPSPTQSLMSTFTVDTIIPDPEEEDRRRKRERLAKLHRFLGSRVPANLVLGIDEHAHEATLPAPRVVDSLSPLSQGLASVSLTGDASPNSGGANKKPAAWMKRRRSSSAGLLPSFRVGDPSLDAPLERHCAELDEKEKAINVRRAHKMEQVFGVAPPQTLYHTRQAVPSPPSSGSSKAVTAKKSTTPPLIALPPIPSITAFPEVLLIRNTNINRSSYNSRKSSKKRPGSAGSYESGRQTLLPGPSDFSHGSSFDDREFGKHGLFGHDGEGAAGSSNLSPQVHHSFVYNHYQHSLKSLNDILDRDDRESLAELHDYLNSTNFTNADPRSPTPTPKTDGQFTTQQQQQQQAEALDQQLAAASRGRSASIASSLKSDRRRSLPSRTSMISLAPSEFSISESISSITSPYAVQQANEFQQRRRRAAKLAQFFGVNYCELVNEVLESIESGVAQEQLRGTLAAEEVEDLLTKLRTLKVKRSRLF